LAGESPHHVEQRARLLLAQGGRGLVEDEHLRVLEQRPRDLDHLAEGQRQVAHAGREIDLGTHLLEHHPGLAVHLGPRDQPGLAGPTADEEILERGQVGEMLGLLRHQRHAELAGSQG